MPYQPALSCENPIEVTALPIPAGFCCPARYFGTMPVSDSLSHPGAGIGGHRIAHFINSWTEQGLTGSVPNLSKRAIPKHSAGLAGVFTHSDSPLTRRRKTSATADFTSSRRLVATAKPPRVHSSLRPRNLAQAHQILGCPRHPATIAYPT